MNPKVIVIDGKTYPSADEMPPDIRQKYEEAMRSLGDANSNRVPDAFESVLSEPANILADKNQNGVPDIVENVAAGQAAVNSMKIIVNGKEFNGLESLPPEARAKYEAAMGKLDANKNGIPDFVEGMLTNANQSPMSPLSTSFPVENSPRSTPIPAGPTITPDTSNGLMLGLAGLFLFLLCALVAGAAWYFFLR
jgi:hypothetical protein